MQHQGRGWRLDAAPPQLLDDTPRTPLLAYGSNACPAKIEWLRTALALPGAVVVRRARCAGLAAVWAAGLRVVDDQRPATLCAAPGVAEDHAVWLATEAQLAVLDVCEGRGVRYRLVRVHTGRVTLGDGSPVPDPLAYVALAAARMPLLVDGHPLRCCDVVQADARALTGVPAPTDGLRVTELGSTHE